MLLFYLSKTKVISLIFVLANMLEEILIDSKSTERVKFNQISGLSKAN